MLTDPHAADVGLDIARLLVLGIARQPAPDFDRLDAVGEDRDAVEALLAVPDRLVADRLELLGREALVLRS